MAQNDWDKQIADATASIEKNPKDAEAYNDRGLAYIEKGEPDKAIADFNKAIELNPDYAEAYSNRGYAYNNKGEHDKAIADLDKAIELQPDLSQAYNNRGVAYGEKSESDRAIADFDKAIGLEPDYAGAYSNRGGAYQQKGDFDKAIADLDKAIELNPDYAAAYNNRGNAYRQKGELAKAIADFDKAIELKPDFVEAYHNRALALAQRQTQEQIKEFKQEAERQKQAFDELLVQHGQFIIEDNRYKVRERYYRRERKRLNCRIKIQNWGIYISSAIFSVIVFDLLFGIFSILPTVQGLDLSSTQGTDAPNAQGFGERIVQWFPAVGFLFFILSIQTWNLRMLNRDKNKYLALEEEMFARRSLVTLFNAGAYHSELRQDMYHSYFQHESRFNVAHLVIAAEQGKLPNTQGDKKASDDDSHKTLVEPILKGVDKLIKQRFPKE